MKLILFANHEMAIPSLHELIKKEMIAGLVMPKLAHEANLRMQAIATQNKIPFIYVDKAAVHNTLSDWIKEKSPDAMIAMTFAYKLPENIISIPKYGCFNCHTGILPEYRGPDPVYWEMMNGDEFGGVTLHKMDSDFDTGPIIKIEKIKITPNQTYGEHYKRAAFASLSLLNHLLDNLVVDPDGLELISQDTSKAKYIKAPEQKELYIKWQEFSADKIKKMTLATNPLYGGARTFFRGVRIHIFQVTLDRPKMGSSVQPGTIIAAGPKEGLVVISKDNIPVSIDCLYCEEGFYSGDRFVNVFNVRRGEQFLDPK